MIHIFSASDEFSRLTCTVNGAFSLFGLASAHVVLLTMALDRFAAIGIPLHYKAHREQVIRVRVYFHPNIRHLRVSP